MDASEVETKAKASLKQVFANKPKMSYAKASEVAANARKALKGKQ